MKNKTNLVFAFFVLVCLNQKAQNSYGKQIYSHLNSECSSGIACVNNSGFLIAGYQKTASNGQYNFYIDRTDKNSVFTSAPYEFQKKYQIQGSYQCTSTTVSMLSNCYGVTAIEQITNGSGYAVAGSSDIGAFFVNLDNSGNVMSQVMYTFPSGARDISKALITESKIYANQFYITGSYSGIMYILRVNNSGAITASYVSDNTSTYSLCPYAILESPYGNNDVTIIGIKDNGSDVDGFFYQIDNTLTTFAGGWYYNYHQGANPPQNSTFHSMVAADPSNSNAGFLIGGNTDGANTGQAWMLKIDPFGTPIWHSVIEGNYCINTSSVLAVAERYSSANSAFECYGAATTSLGIIVYKLDDTGTPTSVSFGTNDEFVYNDGTSTHTRPVAMSFLNNGAPWDEGLHVFGNLNTSQGDHYLVQSYFSGEAGCNNPISTISAAYHYTVMFCVLHESSVTPLSSCYNFAVQQANDPSYAPICAPVSSFPAPASNNKQGLSTGIENNKISNLNIYPNPVKSKMYLNGFAPSKEMKVSVKDILGKEVKVNIVQNANNQIVFDFTNAEINDGIYFISIVNGNTVLKEKFIVEK